MSPMPSIVGFLLHLLLLIAAASSSTSTSEPDHNYRADEAVAPWVYKVGPYNNPEETYNDCSLPSSENPAHTWGGLREVLGGNELIDSQIEIKSLRNADSASISTLEFDASKVLQFTYAIENSYWFEFFIGYPFSEYQIHGLSGFIIFMMIILLKGLGLRILKKPFPNSLHKLIFFITIATMIVITSASLHEVGGTVGWTVPPNSEFYIVWARHSSFVIGDILYFSYKDDHLCSVQKSSYITCNATNPLKTFFGGSTYFEIFQPELYFISSDIDRCLRGQRLAITAQLTPPILSPAQSSPPLPPLASPPPAPLASSPPPPPPASSGSDGGTTGGGAIIGGGGSDSSNIEWLFYLFFSSLCLLEVVFLVSYFLKKKILLFFPIRSRLA